jgi:dinuclear metal center YbgI/SA1388 family protein
MPTVGDIVASMEAWAPPGYAYDWDRVGLQVGDARTPVERVLVCLTPNEEALAAARKAKAQLVVAHHPIIFKPLSTLTAGNPAARLCLQYHEAGIAVFTAHTNLDVAAKGVSHALAKRLGLENTHPLFPAEHSPQYKLITFVPESHLDPLRRAVCEAGAGVIGDYTQCSFSVAGEGTFVPGSNADPYSGEKCELNREPERRLESVVNKARVRQVVKALYEAHPYEEPAHDLLPLANQDTNIGLGVVGDLPAAMGQDAFAAHVREALGCKTARIVRSNVKNIRRVAVLGGSGGGDIGRIPPDVDCYVTGDVKYHEADLARSRGLCVIDAGHVATELPILPDVAEYLKKKHPGIKATVYLEADPFSPIG